MTPAEIAIIPGVGKISLGEIMRYASIATEKFVSRGGASAKLFRFGGGKRRHSLDFYAAFKSDRLLAARKSSPEHFGQVIAAGRPYAAPEGRYWGIEADIDRHGRSLHPSRSYNSPVEDFTVAEITKLSVGQALEKLRGTDAPKAKLARLDEKIDTLDEETQRLRAMRRGLERDQRACSMGAML